MFNTFPTEDLSKLVNAILRKNLGDSSTRNLFVLSLGLDFYLTYATEFLKRNLNNNSEKVEFNPDILGVTSLRSYLKALNPTKLQLLSNNLNDYLIFLVLLKRNFSQNFLQLPNKINKIASLDQLNDNMSTGYSSRDPKSRRSNTLLGLNVDSQSSRNYVSNSNGPAASLWGTASNVSTLDRRHNSRHNFRASSSHKSASGSSITPTENELLREAILTLSGASGSLIQYDPTLDAFVPARHLTLSPSLQTHIMRISACGWLYNRVRSYVSDIRDDPNAGKVALSLALSIDDQLTEYLKLVSTLEAQLNYEISETSRNPTEFSTQNSLTRSGESTLNRPRGCDFGSMSTLSEQSSVDGADRQPLTLVQLRHWLMEPERRLKVLAALVDNCSSLKGGALVSKVYEMCQNGGPKIKTMLMVILEHVTRTVFEMISLWIYDGRLPPDTNQEFFIAVYPSVGRENLWAGKYCLRKSMIPEFISKEQARKILLVGKSVNFLIHVCGDSLDFKDLEAIRNTRLKRVEAIFNQTFDSSFDFMISTAYQHVSKHLLNTLFQKYHFMDHLTACRKFLLLGQGDFIERLMDLLQEELDEPADSIMRHRLSEILETAIRDTNAQYEDSEILRRLNVEVLETAEGDSGWDVFSLGYTVDGPLTTIFTPECRLFYLKSFSFLWRLKRMEFMLSTLWRDQLAVARKPYALPDDLAPILHVVQLLGAEFRHFILQLQYYVNFEALECAWLDLAKKIKSANDLDEVISAHQAFLESVVARCLLDQDSRELRYHLRAIFDLIVNFFQLNQDLQNLANEEEEVRAQLQHDIDASSKTGNWGTCSMPESREMARRKMFVEATITPLTARIRVLASSYRSMVTEFMNKLQNHPDHNLRLLVQSVNFNTYYMDVFGDI